MVTSGGDISINAGGILSLAGSNQVNNTGSGNISVAANSIDLLGNNENSGFTTVSGDVTLDTVTNMTAAGISTTSGDIRLESDSGITLSENISTSGDLTVLARCQCRFSCRC